MLGFPKYQDVPSGSFLRNPWYAPFLQLLLFSNIISIFRLVVALPIIFVIYCASLLIFFILVLYSPTFLHTDGSFYSFPWQFFS